MISKKYMPEAIDSSQQHAERSESARQKRVWADPSMVEVMNATAVRNTCGSYSDGSGCSSAA